MAINLRAGSDLFFCLTTSFSNVLTPRKAERKLLSIQTSSDAPVIHPFCWLFTAPFRYGIRYGLHYALLLYRLKTDQQKK